MYLVKELNLKSVSLVVSDEEPTFDSQYLHMLSLSAESYLNVMTFSTHFFNGRPTNKI